VIAELARGSTHVPVGLVEAIEVSAQGFERLSALGAEEVRLALRPLDLIDHAGTGGRGLVLTMLIEEYRECSTASPTRAGGGYLRTDFPNGLSARDVGVSIMTDCRSSDARRAKAIISLACDRFLCPAYHTSRSRGGLRSGLQIVPWP
jgi:hypothetical protein